MVTGISQVIYLQSIILPQSSNLQRTLSFQKQPMAYKGKFVDLFMWSGVLSMGPSDYVFVSYINDG